MIRWRIANIRTRKNLVPPGIQVMTRYKITLSEVHMFVLYKMVILISIPLFQSFNPVFPRISKASSDFFDCWFLPDSKSPYTRLTSWCLLDDISTEHNWVFKVTLFSLLPVLFYFAILGEKRQVVVNFTTSDFRRYKEKSGISNYEELTRKVRWFWSS